MTKPKICVVGPGVVGQATGKVLALQGFDITFLGGSQDKIEKLREEGYRAYDRKKYFNGLYDFDITILTVPTPSINGKIDLEAIESASIALGKRLAKRKNYHLVVVKSTVPPGTTESIVINNIEKYSGRKVGRDFGACMSPEYLREKTAYEDSLKPWAIVIGEYDKRSGDMLAKVFSQFDCPIFRCSLSEAEIQKYVHNLFNATKISFFNEMREVGKTIGADMDKVFKLTALSSEGMWNPNYGIRDFGPFSGSCLPKDTEAFLDWAQKEGRNPELLRAVLQVNNLLIGTLGLKQNAFEIGSNL